MTRRPTISFGLPVYNGDRYLADRISSLLAQDTDDIEVLISDNASTDSTENICREAAAADSRIRYHRMDENRGAARNYNRVFEMSRGEFFSWAAHDDECSPGFASSCLLGFREANPATVLVHPRASFIDEDGNEIGLDSDVMATSRSSAPGRLRDALWHVNMANAVFGLIRSSALRRTRLIGPFIASDYVLLTELALLGSLVEVPEVLLRRRLHEQSSREANLSLRDVQRWFDPSQPGPRLSARQRLWIEYSRSAWRLSPSVPQRLASLGSIPQVMLTRRARSTAGRWKQRMTGAQPVVASDWRTARSADRDTLREA